eukprot:gene28434-31575_t
MRLLAWAQRILGGLLKGRLLEDFSEYELEVGLQEAFNDASLVSDLEPLPPVDSLAVSLDKESIAAGRLKDASAAASLAGQPGASSSTTSSRPPHAPRNPSAVGGWLERGVLELAGLQVRYQPTWLLAMIAGEDAIAVYNQALIFLLQIRMAKSGMDKARKRSWNMWQALTISDSKTSIKWAKMNSAVQPEPPSTAFVELYGQDANLAIATAASGGREGSGGGGLFGPRDDDVLVQEMSNFVNNLHQFVMDRLLHSAWPQLEKNLETFPHGIIKTLDHVVTGSRSASMQLQEAIMSGRRTMADAAQQFRKLQDYLLRILHARTLKIGSDTDLEFLIMRINFSGFYSAGLDSLTSTALGMQER